MSSKHTQHKTSIFLCITTVSNRDEANSISEQLTKSRLAVCVNIVEGVQSLFFWDNSLQKESELLMLIKCSENKLEELEAALLDMHPYDTPEFICFEASKVSKGYKKWIEENS